MVYDGILLSIIVGLLRKGNFKGIADLNIKFGWVFPLLLVFQILIFLYQGQVDLINRISGFLFIMVYIIGIFLLWLNRKLGIGVQLILIGVVLNFIVMIANDGRMPVSLDAAKVLAPSYSQALTQDNYGKHTALNSETHIGFLGDIIPISDPYPRDQVISIGDIIMNIGIFLFIQKLMVARKRSSMLPA
ncbi:DUF5317 domain-containing protein [Pseudalkalibacillus sp. Hm43]|uniref:DUF5317 domain-containing protein n=1 Tax=Pseudalkalibacillus sp. Hm43 TaxID=3450742 RepID=UPI003F41CB94